MALMELTWGRSLIGTREVTPAKQHEQHVWEQMENTVPLERLRKPPRQTSMGVVVDLPAAVKLSSLTSTCPPACGCRASSANPLRVAVQTAMQLGHGISHPNTDPVLSSRHASLPPLST